MMIWQELLFLTNIENKILWLFCYNINMVVTYDMIEDYAHEGYEVKKRLYPYGGFKAQKAS
ncbi:putative two-component regulator [Campylobacter hyointestinalis]|nr:putative two-component regulator [Campylobacter hyointestinalis]SUW90021.1 putative two-component regulator [Campylobacter hyointestinalis]